ncbi:TPA: hypothetical protein HA241_00530 [Candidatus Woesearchaeota archaeon]|nr:hypothetical protein [Candidatus Woesearchaeota archaeon]
MNKLLLVLFSILVIFVVSCTPPPPGAGDDTALAGEAVRSANRSANCKDVPVEKCIETSKGITITYPKTFTKDGYTKAGVTKSLNDSCSGTRSLDYSCSRKDKFRFCSTPCSSGTSCVVDSSAAKCVPLCGNGRVNAGETCSSCARDVSCATGQQCESGVCVTMVIPPREENVNASGEVAVVVDTSSQSENVIVITVDTLPVLEVTAESGADLSGVKVEVEDSRIAIDGLQGREHYLFIPDTNQAGVYVCPRAQVLADVEPNCLDIIRYTDDQCKSGTSLCSYVDGRYKVKVSGTGAGENEEPALCGNGGVDGDENCLTCGADVTCQGGRTCLYNTSSTEQRTQYGCFGWCPTQSTEYSCEGDILVTIGQTSCGSQIRSERQCPQSRSFDGIPLRCLTIGGVANCYQCNQGDTRMKCGSYSSGESWTQQLTCNQFNRWAIVSGSNSTTPCLSGQTCQAGFCA